jgi:hypothetical protein
LIDSCWCFCRHPLRMSTPAMKRPMLLLVHLDTPWFSTATILKLPMVLDTGDWEKEGNYKDRIASIQH